jgi:hypothetical protein
MMDLHGNVLSGKALDEVLILTCHETIIAALIEGAV